MLAYRTTKEKKQTYCNTDHCQTASIRSVVPYKFINGDRSVCTTQNFHLSHQIIFRGTVLRELKVPGCIDAAQFVSANGMLFPISSMLAIMISHPGSDLAHFLLKTVRGR
jgi:hypothetical protein